MSQSSPFSALPTCPVIAFMTNFGPDDGDVGVLKGVALGIAINVHTLHIDHGAAITFVIAS